MSLIHSVVQNFQDVSFGISTASEVLAYYNITGNTISLFRLVSQVGSSSLLVLPWVVNTQTSETRKESRS